MAVDIECGAFGDNGCIDFVKNGIDRQVDSDSLFKGAFSFEKMFAGNFFGDIVRRTLHNIASKGALFNGKVTTPLSTKDSLMAADCVKMERYDPSFQSIHCFNLIDCFFHLLLLLPFSQGPSEIKSIIKSKLAYTDDDITEDDLAIIDHVCKIVAMRAAILPSTCKF